MTGRALRAAAAAAACAAVVAGLAGCVGGKPDATPAEGELPLNVYTKQVYGSSDEQFVEEQTRVEEAKARCMAEQGFEYLGWDFAAMANQVTAEDVRLELGDRAFVEQFGYGIFTDPLEGRNAGPAPDADPNRPYLSTLSLAEQSAYAVALYGDRALSDPNTEEPPAWDWETAGCDGQAMHEVFSSGEAQVDEDWVNSFALEIEAAYEAELTDPRIAELGRAWAACMSDAGYPGLSRPGDTLTAIDPIGVNPMTMSDADLAELRRKEIEVAVVDLDCSEAIDYDPQFEAVAVELQQAFVDAHKAELETWVDAALALQGRS